MTQAFDISEAIWIEKDGGKYHICPDCVDHEQGPPNEFHDCKNTFFKKGEKYAVGQCMCYGPAHGRRE